MGIDFRKFKSFRWRVKNKWMRYAKDYWWGDRLDSRFISLYYSKYYQNKKILDIGCNIGVSLSELGHTNFKVGLDINERALLIAKILNNNSAGILKADMFNLPFKDEKFDVVLFFGMLELPKHKDKVRCLREINRVLVKDGELIMTTLNRRYISLDNKRNRVDYNIIKTMLSPDYDFKIYGFNPLPSFPLFLPNRILEKIPFIWQLLYFTMRKHIFLNYCRSFLIIARKL